MANYKVYQKLPEGRYDLIFHTRGDADFNLTAYRAIQALKFRRALDLIEEIRGMIGSRGLRNSQKATEYFENLVEMPYFFANKVNALPLQDYKVRVDVGAKKPYLLIGTTNSELTANELILGYQLLRLMQAPPENMNWVEVAEILGPLERPAPNNVVALELLDKAISDLELKYESLPNVYIVRRGTSEAAANDFNDETEGTSLFSAIDT